MGVSMDNQIVFDAVPVEILQHVLVMVQKKLFVIVQDYGRNTQDFACIYFMNFTLGHRKLGKTLAAG